MFLRFLMRLIKPTNEQIRHSKNNNWLSKHTQIIYKWLLNELRKSYLHYAIHDVIIMENGRIKIIHEFRDIEFENELKRNGIDIRPHFLAATLPFSTIKSKSKKWYSYFMFNDLIRVYIDNNEIFIKHDSFHSTNGTISANVKVSSDIISRSDIEIKSKSNMPLKRTHKEPYSLLKADVKNRNKDTNIHKSSTLPRKNIFGRDVIPVTILKPSEKSDEQQGDKSATIEKRGFAIDTTF